jgi:methylglyoxal synthase
LKRWARLGSHLKLNKQFLGAALWSLEVMLVERRLQERKRVALVAHDHKKEELLDWSRFNRGFLAQHEVYATGTTGRLVEKELGIPVIKLQSGPLGGDQQIGARISEGLVDFLVFFWDPLESQPHDPDVKALLRMAVVWNVPFACNRSSADFIISSPLMATEYEYPTPDYSGYLTRDLDVD